MIDLEQNKIDSGFKIPENYFDNFDKIILSKINHPKNKQNNAIIRKIFVYSVSIAASILLIFTITDNNTTIDNYNDLYVENYILNDNFILEESFGNELADNTLQDDLSDSYIEEYLLNDNDYEIFNDN